MSELVRVAATLGEGGRSAVADAVGVAWGVPVGAARFVRSSATHVFVVAAGSHPAGQIFLRFVPDAQVDPDTFGRPVELLSRLAAAGAAVVAPVRSAESYLSETVDTPLGLMHASAVRAAAGQPFDVDELTPELAARWGAALARFHLDAENAADLFSPAPSAFAQLACRDDDPDLAAAAGRLAADWDRISPELPTGVLHGDFELDNLCWEVGRATAFDVDDARSGTFVEDIAFAVRDLVGAAPDRPDHPGLLDAFCAGYHQVRPLREAEGAALGLASALNAARSLQDGFGVIDSVPEPEPAWLPGLRTHLQDFYAAQRRHILTASPDLRSTASRARRVRAVREDSTERL